MIILAGGRSSRMGRDKARLRLGPRTLLGHVRTTARSLDLPVRVIRRDLGPRRGPLGGLVTAFACTRADSLLVLSCDMPFVPAALLHKLLARAKARDPARFVKHRQLVGFPFWIHRTAAPMIEQQLARGEFSLQRLAQLLRAPTLPLNARHGDLWLFNVNTPTDWQQAKRYGERTATRLARRTAPQRTAPPET